MYLKWYIILKVDETHFNNLNGRNQNALTLQFQFQICFFFPPKERKIIKLHNTTYF